jgi:hypothetical protein
MDAEPMYLNAHADEGREQRRLRNLEAWHDRAIVHALGWEGTSVGPGLAAESGIFVPLEGNWATKRLVINEFPTVEIARAWYHSDQYQAAAQKRQETSVGRVLLVGGWNRPW